MCITAYHTNEKGEVVRFRVENSHVAVISRSQARSNPHADGEIRRAIKDGSS